MPGSLHCGRTQMPLSQRCLPPPLLLARWRRRRAHCPLGGTGEGAACSTWSFFLTHSLGGAGGTSGPHLSKDALGAGHGSGVMGTGDNTFMSFGMRDSGHQWLHLNIKVWQLTQYSFIVTFTGSFLSCFALQSWSHWWFLIKIFYYPLMMEDAISSPSSPQS